LFPSLSSPTQPDFALSDGLRDVIDLFAIEDDLIGIIGEMQTLTLVLNNTTIDLSQMRLLSPIQHHLLSRQPTGSSGSKNAVIEEAFCIGARFYLKTIYDYHLRLQLGWVPSNAMMDGAPIQRLKSCLDMIDMDTEQARTLFFWVLFMGGVAVVGTTDRAWFVARLAKAKATMQLQICSWKDAKSSLMRFYWVDRIHEDLCRDLWDDALMTAEVLFGADCGYAAFS